MKKVVWIVAVVLIAVCAIAGIMMRGGKKPEKVEATHVVAVSDVSVKVVESGSVDAFKIVEVKSRVGGRVAKLLVEEGDSVQAGQLLAVIDPQETQLTVDRDQANLRGAVAAVRRSNIEIEQRRVTAKAAYDRARARLFQLGKEVEAQPKLTRLTIQSAKAGYEAAVVQRDTLIRSTQVNERIESESALREAESNLLLAKADLTREQELFKRGYSAKREVEQAQNQVDLATSRATTARDRNAKLADNQALARKNAEEKVVQARSEYERSTTNRIQDSIKQKEYDQALSSLRDAEAGLKDVEALMAARSQSQASVDQIQSGLSDSLRQLGETEIRAPFNGVITKKLIQEGELVSSLNSFSSGTPIVRLEDRRAMLVKLNINEIDVAKLELGKLAEIEVDALPNRTFAGRVTKISPASTATGVSTVDAGTKAVVKYLVEIRMDEVVNQIKSGMTAKCTVLTAEKKSVPNIPFEFLGREGGARFVMVAASTKEGKPTKLKVTTGLESGAAVEITSGLKGGEKLMKPDYKGPARKGMEMFN